MLALIRIVLIITLSLSICIFGIVYCLLSPCQPRNAAVFGRLFGCMAPIFGIKVEIRNFSRNQDPKSCVYISNHQNNYDMVTVSYVMQPKTVTIGKNNLFWIPFFGQLYWLSGNILIDRRIRNIQSVRSILVKVIEIIKTYKVSVWIFPEGTRNNGKRLLPFKTGAFYVALAAKIPIVPICVSNIANNKIKLNRWSNGLVIIEIMPPIYTSSYRTSQVRRISAYCHKIMELKINSLDQEVIERES